MANPFYVEPANPLQALLAGQQGYDRGVASLTRQQQAEARQQAAQALQSGGDPRGALAALIGAGDVQGANALANFGNQALDQQYKMGMLDIARQTAARRDAPTITEIYDETTGQPRKVAVSNAGMVPVGGVKAVVPKTKDLPFGVVKELGERGGSYGDFTRLTEGFADSYGGYRFEKAGDAANWLARNFGVGNEEAATWWQDYQGRKNLIRNQLFGSALTATEKTEFDKANINPGMTPQAIKRNLALQQQATQKAAAKLAKAYVKMGYEPEQIEAALGIPLSGLGITPPASTAPRGGTARTGGAPSAEADPLAQARDAIDRGADRNAVMDVLRQNGIDPRGL